MNCLSCHDHEAVLEAKKEALHSQPLAFSSDPSLVSATSRIVVEHTSSRGKDGLPLLLNVEVFEHKTNARTSPLVIFIPGICESAETKSVQHMALWAKDVGIRLAVLEVAGHGLSEGDRAVMIDWEDALLQVLQSVCAVTAQLLKERASTSYLLSGASMGGTLALYAAEYISRQVQDVVETDTFDALFEPSEYPSVRAAWEALDFETGSFAGVVSITPALGVNREALAPDWIISALKLAADWFPKAQVFLTPKEDPEHYNCPADTTRNFAGHWPLATSRLLLEITSERVLDDLRHKRLTLRHVPRVVLMAGGKDPMIPLSSIQAFEQQVRAKVKELRVLKKAGHDVLTHERESPEALELLFSTLL